MFTTAKEVHVYLDGAIQNIASNRKQSIQAQYLDMILNNAVIEYISSRFPERSKGADIETTLKRYTDFQVLKTKVESTPWLDNSFSLVAKVTKPYDAIKIQAVRCQFIRPFKDANRTAGSRSRLKFTINDSVITDLNPTIGFTYSTNGIAKVVLINLSAIITEINSTKGAFYLYDYLVDTLRTIHKLNVNYSSSTSISDAREIIIDFPIGTTVSLPSTSASIASSIEVISLIKPIPNTGDKIAIKHCSILGSFEVGNALSDHYSNKNLHLNPLCEIANNEVDTQYTDFLPLTVQVTYIRKPKLFNITTGQIPEIDITKDFLDYAVKELLLVLNSPTYDRVNNETIKNL